MTIGAETDPLVVGFYSLLSAIVASGLTAYINHRLTDKRIRAAEEGERVRTTLEFYNRWQDGDVINARHRLSWLRKELNDPEIDFAEEEKVDARVSEKDKFMLKVRKTFLLFCLTSVMIENKKIDEDIFLGAMASALYTTGYRLESYLKHRQELGRDKTLESYFYALFRKVEKLAKDGPVSSS